jgi:hypothetical protein
MNRLPPFIFTAFDLKSKPLLRYASSKETSSAHSEENCQT